MRRRLRAMQYTLNAQQAPLRVCHTGDTAADATWNAAHNGVKQFTMNAADLTENVKLTCTLTGTSPDYGTVYVDEDMNLIHAPAEADANDTLHLENGILSVETEGNEYQLNDNVLGVVRNRLNGSVTAEAWVYTAAPEKLVEFKYDSNGLRTQKKVTDHGQVVTTDYLYHGQKLAGLTCGEDTLHFFYDAQGRPAQAEYDGEIYTYLYNLQGDVLGITNSNGDIVEEYLYTPWGKCKGDMNSAIGKVNPFTYRGYLWVDDIGLYILGTRGYDACRNRFINSDKLIPTRGISVCYNLFCYCFNGPVQRSDASGYWASYFVPMFPFVLFSRPSTWFGDMCDDYISGVKDKLFLIMAAGEFPDYVKARDDYRKASGGADLVLPEFGLKINDQVLWPTQIGFISYSKKELTCNQFMGVLTQIIDYLGQEKTGDILDSGFMVFAPQLNGWGSTIEKFANSTAAILDKAGAGQMHTYYEHALSVRYTGYQDQQIWVDMTFRFYSGDGINHSHFGAMTATLDDWGFYGV